MHPSITSDLRTIRLYIADWDLAVTPSSSYPDQRSFRPAVADLRFDPITGELDRVCIDGPRITARGKDHATQSESWYWSRNTRGGSWPPEYVVPQSVHTVVEWVRCYMAREDSPLTETSTPYYWRADVSTDGGATWTAGEISTDHTDGIPPAEHFDGSARGWARDQPAGTHVRVLVWPVPWPVGSGGQPRLEPECAVFTDLHEVPATGPAPATAR